MNIINIQNKKDLITLDLRCKQTRYIKNNHLRGSISFIPLSSDDVAGYEYLFNNDKALFFNSLKEDVLSFLNIKLNVQDLKVLD